MRSADRAYGLILQDILEGGLAAGTRLVEPQLAERLSISRTPVREALFRLQQEGFVETELRRGFSVRALSEAEARDAYPVVAELESLALADGGALLKGDVTRLRKANKALQAARRDPQDSIDADRAFHLLLSARSTNQLLLQLIGNLHRVLFRYEYVYMSDASLIGGSVEQHEAIIDAIAAGSIRSACDALRRNYDAGVKVVIAKIREAERSARSLRNVRA